METEDDAIKVTAQFRLCETYLATLTEVFSAVRCGGIGIIVCLGGSFILLIIDVRDAFFFVFANSRTFFASLPIFTAFIVLFSGHIVITGRERPRSAVSWIVDVVLY